MSTEEIRQHAIARVREIEAIRGTIKALSDRWVTYAEQHQKAGLVGPAMGETINHTYLDAARALLHVLQIDLERAADLAHACALGRERVQ